MPTPKFSKLVMYGSMLVAVVIAIVLLVGTMKETFTVSSPYTINNGKVMQGGNITADITNDSAFTEGNLINFYPADADDTCTSSLTKCIQNPNCAVMNDNPTNKSKKNRCVLRTSAVGLNSFPGSTAYHITGR